MLLNEIIFILGGGEFPNDAPMQQVGKHINVMVETPKSSWEDWLMYAVIGPLVVGGITVIYKKFFGGKK